MKNVKRIIKSALWVGILSVGLFFYLKIGATFNTMEVGFYGLSDDVVSVITTWLDNRNIDWKPVVFDASKPLEDQLTVPVKQNLLFTTDSKNMDTIAPYVRTAKTKNLLLMPVSVRTAVQTNSRLTATPILLDHFQLSYNINYLRNSGVAIPTNFIDLEAIADDIVANRQSAGVVAPILCAGGDDESLIQFFSAMIETMHGIESYETIQAFLEQVALDAKGNELLASDAFDSFFDLPQVQETLRYIVNWENKRILSSSWLDISEDDIKRAMENNSAIFTFMPFSDYEELSDSAKNSYAPWFMPSGSTRENRYLVAPSVVVMEFSYVKSPLQSARQSAKKNNLASSIIEEMVSGFIQSQLASDSNLVPVNASAQITEMGAGETRQLFTLADGIIPDIAASSFVRLSDKTQFAQSLRIQLLQIENN